MVKTILCTLKYYMVPTQNLFSKLPDAYDCNLVHHVYNNIHHISSAFTLVH
jgi:hypothetical protein